MSLIQRETPYLHWEFSDPVSGVLLRVVPERGGHEVVYLDLERFLDPTQSVRGGFPVLFPITRGLPDNQLPLPQGVFNLGQHGFARQRHDALQFRFAPILQPLQPGERALRGLPAKCLNHLTMEYASTAEQMERLAGQHRFAGAAQGGSAAGGRGRRHQPRTAPEPPP